MELFNRPSDIARQEGVLLLLTHAFEMLLKGVVLEKTGRIRSPRDRYNYGFEKCLNIVQDQLSLVDKDEVLILKNLNGFRDAAAHDLVEMSEGLLYGHAQSALNIFGTLLKKVFSRDLVKELPRRVLPICTVAPSDISMVVAQDMASIGGLLGVKRRREDEAESRLRPYQVIERNIREVQGIGKDAPSTSRLVRRIKSGDWKVVLPMVAGLVQPATGGIPISLHVTKGEGFPIRIDPSAPTAIAFRYIKPEDKYPYLTSELAVKIGISISRVVGFVKLFGMKGNEAFHTSMKISASGIVHRYSDRTRRVIEEAIRKHGVEQLWSKAKAGEKLAARDYLPSGALTTSASTPTVDTKKAA
ncbi:MAG: hypothetical protein HY360_24660 [Verrucomicrobia bacterium]|nr:hypothetical protein [Verrucomicrobiota bacterium]